MVLGLVGETQVLHITQSESPRPDKEPFLVDLPALLLFLQNMRQDTF